MRSTFKTILLTAGFVCFFMGAAFSQQVAKSFSYPASPDGVIGFLQFTPSDYGSQKHPLIIFLHGIGERGNGTTQINSVANNGTPNLCAHGATMRFTVGGQTSSFVVLSPQLSTQYGYWPTFYVKQMIAYAKANLIIDTNRIYVTGLSLGGGGVWRVITDTQNFDHTFDGTIAAAAPVCGTQEETDADFCTTIGTNHLPIWAFHCMDDATVGVGATQHAQILSQQCGVTPASIFTYYQSGGHGGAWINAYDTGHISRVVSDGSTFTANPNLYEWFLSNKRGSGTTYTAPVANAGTAQTITLPTSSVTLTGTGTGTGGASISSYSWVKTSGPSSGTITSATAASTTVTGLVQGTYVFTLTVTDNHGLINSSSVTITVNATNTAPVANAGSAQTIALPANTVTLTGTGTGTNGATISSYAWVKTSGPSSGTITSATAASTTVTGLVQGTYVFTLTVKDNHGLTNSSAVTITVNAAGTAPTVSAGSDQTITLPTNSVTLNGTSSGNNGANIVYVIWLQISGPSTSTIVSLNTASTQVTGLVQGTYVYSYTVADNNGLSNRSTVTITVNPASTSTAPTASAGSNQTITLPTNSVTLTGTSAGTNGANIVYVIWLQISGPSTSTIISSLLNTTQVTNLVQGTYVYSYTVADNNGLSARSTVTITVNPSQTIAGVQPIGYIKVAAGPPQACGDASTDGRIPIYCNSIANGNVVYLDAAHTQIYNGGFNWFSYTPSLGAASAQAFSVFPDGIIHLLTSCNNSTAPVTPAPTTPGNLLGYIKVSTGPYQACADASSGGRTAVYGTSIANGSYLYTDSAMTQVYNGGWNWFSFTPVLGGPTTNAFAIYPIGSILLLKNCTAGYVSSRTTGSSSLEDGNTLQQEDASLIPTGKLSIYPNPVRSNATIQLSSTENAVKTINIYNANGVLKAKYNWQTIKGNNVFSLKEVTGLASGLYIIDIRDSNGKSNGTLKFIKM